MNETEKTLYVAWFGNRENDKLWISRYEQARLVQPNLLEIDNEVLDKICSISERETKEHLKKHFKWASEEHLNLTLEYLNDPTNKVFLTRTFPESIETLKFEILKSIWDNSIINVVWHSQWWVLAMLTIIKNPYLLVNINEIVLAAPVTSYWESIKFHKNIEGDTKEAWLMPQKWVWITWEYIQSIENSIDNKNILKDFIKILYSNARQWTLRIMWWTKDWKTDWVVWINESMLNQIRDNLFEDIEIEAIDFNIELEEIEWGNHYLITK